MSKFRLIAGIFIASFCLNVNAEPKWQYVSEKDEMTGKLNEYAVIESNDLISLDFPHKGKNQPKLIIRKHSEYGIDAILQVDKGQFLCGINDCNINVKFDETPPVKYIALKPADRSTTVLFITPSKKFIKAAQKAKQVKIQATFFRQGDRVMTFNIAGLNWKY